jgi:hypothetical protein
MAREFQAPVVASFPGACHPITGGTGIGAHPGSDTRLARPQLLRLTAETLTSPQHSPLSDRRRSLVGPVGKRQLAGSVTAFSLNFPKKLFTYKGVKHGYLLAKCSNGKFLAQAEAKFSDGTKVGPAQIVRACTPKG